MRGQIWTGALVALSMACSSGSSGGGGSGSGGTGGGGGSAAMAGSGATAGSAGDPYYAAVPAERRSATVSAACPAAFQNPPAAGQNVGFDSGGQSRSFLLALPDAAQFPGPRPTFVLFNGTGESGQAIYNRISGADYAAAGFIVIAPDSIGNGTLWPVWDGLRESGQENAPNLDLDYFDQLLDCIAAHYEVDNKRLYVGGHSAGGIFTNYLVRRRSDVLAGAIPASGVFDLTAPAPVAPLSPVAVAVTWGGDNDVWGGNSGGGVSVPAFNFVEQAALASQYYEQEAAVEQTWCRGDNLGHAWLPANAWLIDFLLGHPKGLATGGPWAPASNEGAGFKCSQDAAPLPPQKQVVCATSTTAGCQTYCQFLGDCAAENATIEPVLGPQLDTLGFGPPNHTDCGGCVPKCEGDAKDASDATVLSCFESEFAAATCGPGISGAQPLIDASNKCCAGQTASGVCTTLCQAIKTNSAAAVLFTSCAAF